MRPRSWAAATTLARAAATARRAPISFSSPCFSFSRSVSPGGSGVTVSSSFSRTWSVPGTTPISRSRPDCSREERMAATTCSRSGSRCGGSSMLARRTASPVPIVSASQESLAAPVELPLAQAELAHLGVLVPDLFVG